MTKDEFLQKYGDVKVKFESYYKYSFTFKGTLPNGDLINVSVGGGSEEIYRLEVGTEEQTIRSLDPVSGDVYHSNGNNVPYDSFYEY